MKRKLIYGSIVSCFMFHSYVHAAEEDSVRYTGHYEITGSFPLPTGESQLVVTFRAPAGTPARSNIKIVVNGDTLTPSYIDSTGTYVAHLTPGKYQFSFINQWWNPVNTPVIEFSAFFGTKITVYFTAREIIIPGIEFDYDKPVIYLYPEEKTEVDIKLSVKGEIGFTYPAYNNGWKVTAHPDGTLETNNKKYNYLFWDGKMEPTEIKTDWASGFIIHRDSLTGFFEKSLSHMGLTSKEQQDFITYWVPRMIKNEWNYVHFLFNEEYAALAKLDVTPVPASMFRVFMIWDNVIDQQRSKSTIKEQPIEAFKRSGFTVLEWGGSEFGGMLKQ
ncbi:MAG: hypothetical protein ACHQF2_02415 [Flavobacteriales bacterium]